MVFSLGIDIVDAHPLNCKTKNKILYIDPPLPESRSCFTRMKMKWCEIVRTSFPNGEELSVTLGVSTKVVMVALMIIYSMIVQAYVRTSKSSEDEFSYLNAGTMAVMHFIGIQMMVVSSIYHMPYLMVPVMAHDMFLLLSSILTIVSDFLPIFIMFTDRNSYVLDVPYPVIVIATICRLVNTSLQMRIYQFLTGFEVKTVRRSDI